MDYIKGLNGVRAFAVLFVIISHWFPQDHITRIFPLGNFGVDIFFVLSGFLITRILFKNIKLEKNNYQIWKSFMVRRIIRIFPIYYITLLFLYLTQNTIGNNFTENINWYLFYGANYLNFIETKWFGSLAHLWSLSVEEQFYILWPLLLLFILKSKRVFIIITIVIFIVVGTITPYFINGWTKILTICSLNSFGLGMLFAYVEIYRPSWEEKFLKVIKALSIICLVFIIMNYCFIKIPYFSGRLTISIIALQIIIFFKYKDTRTVYHKVLDSKILYFLGNISYGLYLFHNFIPKYWKAILSRLNINTPYSLNYEFTYWESFLMFTTLVLISYISWILIEKPILKLKKYVKY